jgi:ATP-dependent exoDNAse (exonuclease V) beta subunit
MCCVQVEVDPIDKGALRVARSADQHDVLLCEELKYLYTALTRAKNNVIIFDSNTANRAPFFNYLRRLGMAQYVSR